MKTIIDARVRLPQDRRSSSVYLAPLRQVEQYDRVLDLSTKINNGTFDQLVRSMDGAGVQWAVMHAESEGGEDAQVLNEALVAILDAYPRFRGLGALNIIGHRLRDVVQQVSKISSEGMAGLSIQHAFLGMDIDDRSLYPAYSKAEELGLVVAVHTGVTYSRMHPLRHERPELLDQVACDFPDLRLVACHAGWPWVSEYCAVALRHPTVFLEFGGLAPKYVARAGTGWDPLFGMMRNRLRSQVLYGSDWPVMSPERALREWRGSGLDAETLKSLTWTNAACLFGFNEDAEQVR